MKRNNKVILGGLLFGTSVLAALTPLQSEKVYAIEKDDIDTILTSNENQLNEIDNPISKLITKDNDAKFKDDFSSLAYIKTDLTIYHKDPNEKVFNQKSANLLPTGSYANVEKVEVFSNETYVLLSVLGKETGWVSEDSIEYASHAEISETKDVDSEKVFGVLNNDQVVFDKPRTLKDSKLLPNNLVKDTPVVLLQEVTTNKELSFDTWFLFKDAESEGFINISDLKDLELFGLENAKGTLKTDNVKVYKDAKYSSEVVKELKTKDTVVDLFSKKIENLDNIKDSWLKIKLSDGTETFVPKESITYIEYATDKDVHDINNLGYILEDSVLLNKPDGFKDSTISGSVTKDSLVSLKTIKTVNFKGKESKWVSVSKDGKELGYLPFEKVKEVNSSEEIMYTLKSGETADSVISQFNIDKGQFYLMNLSKADSELSEGMSVRLQQKPQVYDTSSVSGSNKTMELVREMMPSVDSIKDAGLKPSVAFAQAIHESGGGSSGLATKSNNLFGIKGTYKGQGSSWSTWEDYGGGSVTINATFRAYPSKVESILDYIDLIKNNGRYSGAVNASSPLEAISAIKNGGYATDPNYVSSVMNVINSYDLTQFDI